MTSEGMAAAGAVSADPLPAFDAVVLAGGQARRLGGVVKAQVVVGGQPMIEYALLAVADARHTVIVGPAHLARPRQGGRSAVPAVLEDPPSGGPAAGLAAGLAAIPEEHAAPFVVVLACDMPRAGSALPLLFEALGSNPPCDGARLVDAAGRPQNLPGVFRSAALRHAVTQIRDRHGVHNLPLGSLVAGLQLRGVADPQNFGRDADTWDAVAAIDQSLGDGGRRSVSGVADD